MVFEKHLVPPTSGKQRGVVERALDSERPSFPLGLVTTGCPTLNNLLNHSGLQLFIFKNGYSDTTIQRVAETK